MIYKFNCAGKVTLDQVGGKAKSLIETTRAGMPVPEGIVLSVAFFDEWLDKIRSSIEWYSLLDDPTKENCNKVKELAGELRFSDHQREALYQGLDGLVGSTFAVRSSSPDEDLEGNSFAGVYETYLGIDTKTLEATIAKAFSSCFDFRAVEYKRQNAMDLNKSCIAVIVQRQIASDISGVGFSLNPLNNCYDEVFINASFGLGEAIVSGVVTPDTYIVDGVGLESFEKEICEKKIGLWLAADGGVTEKPNLYPKKQALTDEQIIEVVRLVKSCEKHYGLPIDIEWAYENSELYLLQARPVTTYFPLFPELVTEPGEDKCLYIDLTIMTQGFDTPMSVLGSDIWRRQLEVSKGEVLICDSDGTSPILHGKSYMNVSNMQKAFGKKMTDKTFAEYDENIRKIFSAIDTSEYMPRELPDRLKRKKLGLLKMLLRMTPSILKALFSDYKKTVSEYNLIAEEVTKEIDALSSGGDFRGTVEVAAASFSRVISAASFTVVGMVSLNKIAKIFKGMNIEGEIAALGMDLQGNPTSAMGHLMFKLAANPEFQGVRSREEFIYGVTSRTFSESFLLDIEEYLRKYGFRGFMEIDIATKREYEEIGATYDRLKEINVKDNQLVSVKERRDAAYERLLEIARGRGAEKQFIKHAEVYQGIFGYREHPKYMVVYIIAKLRNIALEIGGKFVTEGRLDEKEHIFDLRIDEIAQGERIRGLNLRVLRERNIAPYRRVSRVREWPLVVDSRGKIFKPKLEANDGDLIGSAIAPGTVRGIAKVLRTPYEKTLNPGEILVTKATEPSWAPIFINAAGVVMEIGGPLQHGGIIAREYGIPCVSGLMGIMDLIEDGDVLEVDGTNGIVRLFKGEAL